MKDAFKPRDIIDCRLCHAWLITTQVQVYYHDSRSENTWEHTHFHS